MNETEADVMVTWSIRNIL